METTLYEHIGSVLGRQIVELPSFISFLNNVRLLRSHNVNDLPRLPASNYFEFTSNLIAYLVSTNSSNVLVSGYKDSSFDNRYNSRTTNSYSNFQVNRLREPDWERVFLIAGQEGFLNMIVNYRGFLLLQDGNTLQIFGDAIPFKHFPRQDRILSKNNIMYRSKNAGSSRRSLLPQDLNKLYMEIFSSPEASRKELPRRMKRAKRMLKSLIANERKCRYDLIYWKHLSGQAPNFQQILKNATPMPLVIEVVFSTLQQLLPTEVWGGRLTKKILRKAILRIINLLKLDHVNFRDLILGIKLSEVKWLGDPQITSKQDFEKRNHMLTSFLYWLLDKLVPNILKSYWYISESSSSSCSDVLYFTHEIWNQITRRWVSHYSKANLIKLQLTEAEAAAIQLNFGFMRLIPKSSDFRVICVPSRIPICTLLDPNVHVSNGQHFEFKTYNNEVLLPVGQILRSKLKLRLTNNGFFNRTVRSTADVAQCIVEYRKMLADMNDGVLPKLYVLKFDMMQCYDRLDQSKIMAEVESLFAGEGDDNPYYYRQYHELDSSLEKWKKTSRAIYCKASDFSLGQDTGMPSNIGRTYIDKVKTLKLYKRDILKVCHSQIFDSKVIMKNPKGHYEIFKRKRGVFQGLSLLGTFCDMVYSTMVTEKFKFLASSPTNLLVRLADDFLFISTNLDDCKRVQVVVNSDDLHPYGAYVNQSKTLFIEPDSTQQNVTFVGLEIYVPRLEIRKDHSGTVLTTSKYRSFKSLLNYLKTCLQHRLHPYLIDISFGGIFPVLDNISAIVEMIVGSFTKDYTRLLQLDRFDDAKFLRFLNGITSFVTGKYLEINNTTEYIAEISALIDGPMTKCLRARKEFRFVLSQRGP